MALGFHNNNSDMIQKRTKQRGKIVYHLLDFPLSFLPTMAGSHLITISIQAYEYSLQLEKKSSSDPHCNYASFFHFSAFLFLSLFHISFFSFLSWHFFGNKISSQSEYHPDYFLAFGELRWVDYDGSRQCIHCAQTKKETKSWLERKQKFSYRRRI